MKKLMGTFELAEQRKAKILELVKTKPLREIQKVYPKLTSQELGKIVLEDLHKFKMNKQKMKEDARADIF